MEGTTVALQKKSSALNHTDPGTARDDLIQRLEARDRELTALTEHIPGGIHQCVNDEHFTLISVTSGFLALVGYTREELREQFDDRFGDLILPEDLPAVRQTVWEQLGQGDTVEVEYRVRRKDGSVLWLLDKAKLTLLPDGTETLYSMLLDDTVRRGEREELRLSLERHRIIMDQATDIIFDWDIPEDALHFSPNWRKKFGYDAVSTEISRRIPLSENIHPDDMPAFIKIMEDTRAGHPYSEAEFRIRGIQGEFVWCRIRATTQYDDGGVPVKAVGVIVDIDADKKQWQSLMEQARRDSLTGLLNKAAARQMVETCLAAGEAPGVLLMIDLDKFKGINDRYGHLAGDAVLADTAAQLKGLFRSGDVLARIGGDEFLAFLPDTPTEEAGRKAWTVIRALAKVPVLGRQGLISCSVGAAAFPADGGSFPELYRSADLALYHVKSGGKGGVRFYTPELTQGLEGNVLRSSVGAAIDSDAGSVNERLGQYCFRMLYQTIEPSAAVEQMLEAVGRTYDVSRVYIFESVGDGRCCSNTFEWCGSGVHPEQQRLQNVAYPGGLEGYLNHFTYGIFNCGDVGELETALRGELEGRGIRSLLQCAITDGGVVRGFVGFDECRACRRWTQAQIETLHLVANILSTFLLKLRYKERLAQLEAQSGGGALE